MKKILSFVLLSFLCLSANFAQSLGISIHYGNLPNCNKILNFNSGINATNSVNNQSTNKINNSCFSIGGSLNYSPNAKAIFRLKLLAQRSEYNSEEFIGSPFTTTTTITSSQRSIQLAPSVIWEMGTKPFKPRIGIELPITLPKQTNYRLEFVDEYLFDFGSNENEIHTQQISDVQVTSGIDFGIGFILGVSYRLNKFISLNAELSPRIVFSNYTSTVKSEQVLTQFPRDREKAEDRAELSLKIEEKKLGLVPNVFEIAVAFNF